MEQTELIFSIYNLVSPPPSIGVFMSQNKRLQSLISTYGINSVEFLNEVEAFLIWVQRKHSNRFDIDIHHNCYMNLLIKLKYFDPDKKNNIVSFIYTLVRNEVTKANYHLQKRTKECDISEQVNLHYYHNSASVETSIFIKNYISKLKIMSIEIDDNLIRKIELLPQSNGLKRSLNWELMKTNPHLMTV